MEEILASIRRIIADDHGTPINPRPSRAAPSEVAETPAAPAPAASARAFAPRAELSAPRAFGDSAPVDAPRRPSVEALAASRDVPPQMRSTEPPAVLPSIAAMNERAARAEQAAPELRPVLRHTFDEPARPDSSVAATPDPISDETVIEQPVNAESQASVHESLLSPLARASVTSAFEALTVSMSVQNSSIVEDAVREMLRPMLKEWLDANLPVIVERLVRAEIERVARGGRA